MKLRTVSFKKGKLDVEVGSEKRPFLIVYSQGEAKLTYLPEHGETKVITHQGLVKRIKFDEGVDF